MKYADLHVHTHYSDSTFSPEEVMHYAAKRGLAAIAICDHDSVEGVGPCQALGEEAGVEVIPGIELTAEKPDAEIHILGYFVDWKNEPFRKKLAEIRDFRVLRMREMIARLKEEGVEVDESEVFHLAAKGCVGRLHLAEAMVKSGKIKSKREAFDKYIGFKKPCYVSNVKSTPKEAIGLILKVGGVPVLAHPAILNKDEYIVELIEEGLRGIEVFHTDHRTKETGHYEKMAKHYGLLITGGSDCHGLGKGRVLIGSVRVPYALVDKLRKESEAIKAAK